LVEEHRLSLDDTVGHWLPGVVHGNGNNGNKITVRELLQHTSGLHNYTDDLQAQITSPEAYRKLEFHQFSRPDLLDIALAHQPDSAPGAAWNYSNTNYILLGMIIEKVTHDSFLRWPASALPARASWRPPRRPGERRRGARGRLGSGLGVGDVRHGRVECPQDRVGIRGQGEAVRARAEGHLAAAHTLIGDHRR